VSGEGVEKGSALGGEGGKGLVEGGVAGLEGCLGCFVRCLVRGKEVYY
jgi:hypothetical protein